MFDTKQFILTLLNDTNQDTITTQDIKNQNNGTLQSTNNKNTNHTTKNNTNGNGNQQKDENTPNTSAILFPITSTLSDNVIVEVRTTQPQTHRVNLARLPPQASLVFTVINPTAKETTIFFFVEKLSYRHGDAGTVTLFWTQCHARTKTRKYKDEKQKSSRDERAPSESGMEEYMRHLLLQLASTKTSVRSGKVDAVTCCSQLDGDESYHSWLRVDLGPRSSIENLRVLFNVTQESQKLGKILAPFFRIRAFEISGDTIKTIGQPFITGVINRGKNEERVEKYMETVRKFWPEISIINSNEEMKRSLHTVMNRDIGLNDAYDYHVVWRIVHQSSSIVQRLLTAAKNVIIRQQNAPLAIKFTEIPSKASAVSSPESPEVRFPVYNSMTESSANVFEYMMRTVPTAMINRFKVWTDYGPNVGQMNLDDDDDDDE
jgi:hypothetical protein